MGGILASVDDVFGRTTGEHPKKGPDRFQHFRSKIDQGRGFRTGGGVTAIESGGDVEIGVL